MNNAIHSTAHALDRFSAGRRMESVLLAEIEGSRSGPERPVARPINFAHGGDDEGWPGQSCWVRAPYPCETMLSFSEVAHAVRVGILNVVKRNV